MATTRKKTATTNGDRNEPVELGGDVSNAGEPAIEVSTPYVVQVTIMGVCPMIFHRWQTDDVEAKANSAKGSSARKTDNLESYVWRNEKDQICLPGDYLRASLTDPRKGAAKFRVDPRSTRKSALDLYTAAVHNLTELAPLHLASGRIPKTWEYVDRRRAVVNQAGITRSRPTFKTGWYATIQLLCQTAEYISPLQLHAALIDAGRLVGVADNRPTFGRFQVTEYKVMP